jgi:hypothetical protein
MSPLVENPSSSIDSKISKSVDKSISSDIDS